MKPWHWIIIVVFLVVVAFAIYAINQAQAQPKVIVQSSGDQKADMWTVIAGLTGVLKDQIGKKKDEEEQDPEKA